jgi:hypothetical protein
MPNDTVPQIGQLGWPIHREFNAIVAEPLPSRWIGLILALNDRDRLKDKKASEQLTLRSAAGRLLSDGYDPP